MKVNYRVLQIIPDEHSIVVRYFTDKISEDDLAIDKNTGTIKRTPEGYPERCRTDYNLNIFKVPSPTKEEIMDIIMSSAPADWLTMQEAILDENIDTSLSVVEDLLGTVGEVDRPLMSEVQSIQEQLISNTSVTNA